MSGVVCVQEDANARIHNVLLIFSFFSVEISELKDLSFFLFLSHVMALFMPVFIHSSKPRVGKHDDFFSQDLRLLLCYGKGRIKMFSVGWA